VPRAMWSRFTAVARATAVDGGDDAGLQARRDEGDGRAVAAADLQDGVVGLGVEQVDGPGDTVRDVRHGASRVGSDRVWEQTSRHGGGHFDRRGCG
jgi:hypothetical protein